ncbi:hypothetical protein IWQ62_002959 [Dispira parvispora]|uniref:Swi5-dependent recombination DNA repair protein 1 n=1 Tax=Dispira parvispora TaxID=1520584 RepID=A0A9W8ASR0_9FUNG|nr:hypothetical protein IWQ62_002959 [Dispira parvispora]
MVPSLVQIVLHNLIVRKTEKNLDTTEPSRWFLTTQDIARIFSSQNIKVLSLLDKLMDQKRIVAKQSPERSDDLLTKATTSNLPGTPQILSTKQPVPIESSPSTTPLGPRTKRLRTISTSRLSKPFRSPLKSPSTPGEQITSLSPATLPRRGVRTTRHIQSPLGKVTSSRSSGDNPASQLSPSRRLFTSKRPSSTLVNPHITTLSQELMQLKSRSDALDTQIRRIHLIQSITKQNEAKTIGDLIQKWRAAIQDAVRYLYKQWKDVNPEALVQNSRSAFDESDLFDNSNTPRKTSDDVDTDDNLSDSDTRDAISAQLLNPGSRMTLQFILNMFSIDHQLVHFDPDDDDFID